MYTNVHERLNDASSDDHASAIGVVGAGQMGSGIAMLCAYQGCSVVLYDPWKEALDRAEQALEKALHKDLEKKRITMDQSQQIQKRFQTVQIFEPLSGVHGVIEAVPEELSLKKNVLSSLNPYLAEHTWVATNTSSLSVTALAGFLERPQQFMGMHFFNPPRAMPLVEIIKTPLTSEETYQKGRLFVEGLGKVAIACADQPGFIVNRLILRMIREAIGAWQDGVGSIQAIDQAVVHGAHHPMGPLTLADFIGLDVCLNILKTFHQAWPDQGTHPPLILEKMVAQQWLGRKSGRGFYDYSSSDPVPQDGALRNLI